MGRWWGWMMETDNGSRCPGCTQELNDLQKSAEARCQRMSRTKVSTLFSFLAPALGLVGLVGIQATYILGSGGREAASLTKALWDLVREFCSNTASFKQKRTMLQNLEWTKSNGGLEVEEDFRGCWKMASQPVSHGTPTCSCAMPGQRPSSLIVSHHKIKNLGTCMFLSKCYFFSGTALLSLEHIWRKKNKKPIIYVWSCQFRHLHLTS